MRLLPKRAPKAPADLRDRLDIPRAEKVIAWGSGPMTLPGTMQPARGYLAATDHAFYVEGTGERVTWDRISQASWQEPLLEVVLEDESGRVAGRLRLNVDQSGDLPAAVHDRVTDSVVVSEMVDLGDGVKARMAARRANDHADIRWTVVFDAGADASDPELQARARAALEGLRASLGI
jgi:hypothetical protein